MHEVCVKFTRQVTPDVHAGLRLYGGLTGDVRPGREETTISRWRYWFDNNPHAQGFFGVAKCGDRVVGFRSLIPLAMHVKGRRMLGAKGEFFAVDPDYRSSLVNATNQTLPVALQVGLRDWAYQQGLQAHFGVGTPAAMTLAILTGGKLLEFPCVNCSFPFAESLSTPEARSKYNSLLRMALRALMPCLRQWARFRCQNPSDASLESFLDFPDDTTREQHDRNHFIAPDARSLEFRFPSDRYVKLSATARKDALEARFVFSQPTKGTDVRLLYWSAELEAVKGLLDLVVLGMIRRCAAARARKLTFVVPETDQQALMRLRKLGFRLRRGSEKVVLHFRDPEDNSELSPQRWSFNLAHQRFYQDW